VVGDLEVLDEHLAADEPDDVDDEAEAEGPRLQLDHLGGLVGDDSQEHLFLDVEVVGDLFDDFVPIAKQRSDLFALSGAGDVQHDAVAGGGGEGFEDGMVGEVDKLFLFARDAEDLYFEDLALEGFQQLL
jgi:hypothetical protein